MCRRRLILASSLVAEDDLGACVRSSWRGATRSRTDRAGAAATAFTRRPDKRPLLLREVRAGQAWLALAAGDMAAVQRWATTYAQPGDDVPLIQQEREALIVARMLIAQDEAEAALHLLERWQAEAHAQGRTRSELEIMVLTALAHFSQTHLPQARQMLLQALALAQPEGYQRLFLDEGEPMAALLQAVLPEVSEEPLITYVQTLLAAFAILDCRRLAWILDGMSKSKSTPVSRAI